MASSDTEGMAGASEKECRAIFFESMRDRHSRLGVDPLSHRAETAIAFLSRLADECIHVANMILHRTPDAESSSD